MTPQEGCWVFLHHFTCTYYARHLRCSIPAVNFMEFNFKFLVLQPRNNGSEIPLGGVPCSVQALSGFLILITGAVTLVDRKACGK